MILSHLHDVLFLPFEIAADYILPLSAFFLLVFSFLREFTRYAVFKNRKPRMEEKLKDRSTIWF